MDGTSTGIAASTPWEHRNCAATDSKPLSKHGPRISVGTSSGFRELLFFCAAVFWILSAYDEPALAQTLQLSFSPSNPTVSSTAPLGSVVTTITASWSNGSPFTGTLSFGTPYGSDNGVFAISGNNLILNPAGPGLSNTGNTTVSVTVAANQASTTGGGGGGGGAAMGGGGLPLGGDGYARAMWRGTDGSISIWKLDPSLNSVGSQNYGPYSGWSPIAMTTAGSNLSYVLWNFVDGTAEVWQVDANLNFVLSSNFGPVAGWTAEGLGGDSSGNIRLLWKSNEGQVAVWTLNPASLNLIAQSVFGPYFGWNPP
jgi:hypothetical protein